MGKARPRTVDPEAVQAARRELIEKLEKGFQQVQESDEYRRYLATVSRFHKYSISNTMLIWMQRPVATLVAGFRAWLSLGRQVRKGERGIRIFAPMPYKRTFTVTDEETGEPNEQEIAQLRFRAVSVFDLSQTEGDDLPEPPVALLRGDDGALWDQLALIATGEELAIDRSLGRGQGANGWYAKSSRSIWVDPGLEPVMAAKTLCHEIAHHFAEHIDSRKEHETIAESVAFVVLGHFGIDASDYSFGYLASWSDLPTFRAKLTFIQAIASRIIDQVERRDSLGDELGARVPLSKHGSGEGGMGAGPGPHPGSRL
jgi:hypothetical protein